MEETVAMSLPDFTGRNLPLSFTEEDLARLKSMESASQRAINIYLEGLKSALVERLEIHLGRVPSDDEIRQHGFCGIYPDGTREYRWKGEPFLRIAPIFTPPARSA